MPGTVDKELGRAQCSFQFESNSNSNLNNGAGKHPEGRCLSEIVSGEMSSLEKLPGKSANNLK